MDYEMDMKSINNNNSCGSSEEKERVGDSMTGIYPYSSPIPYI
jgi:hypothetical protein